MNKLLQKIFVLVILTGSCVAVGIVLGKWFYSETKFEPPPRELKNPEHLTTVKCVYYPPLNDWICTMDTCPTGNVCARQYRDTKEVDNALANLMHEIEGK